MAEYICNQCRYIGKPKRIKRGSGKVELFGWLCFPFGLPYTIWRMACKTSICPHCGSAFLTSTKTAVGKRLVGIERKEMAELATPTHTPESSPPREQVRW